MNSDAAILESDRVQDYCRRARRLRHRLAHAPVRLHRTLRSLRPIAAPPVEKTPNDRFADAVAAGMESGTLRYSRRLKLLREAETLGIERFEANLIIAMVQHRLNGLAVPKEPSRTAIAPWLVMIAVQAVVVLGALWIWTTLR